MKGSSKPYLIFRKLFVGGIHWNTTDEGMRAYFEQFGQVTDCHIMKDPTGKSRCFGFVGFADPAVVDTVVQKTHILDGKQIDPKRAVAKSLHQQQQQQQMYQQQPMMGARPRMARGAGSEENKIFVGGIHIAVEEAELKEFFNSYDTVLDVVLMRDHTTGRSRGFGFVTFQSQVGVQKAVGEKFIEYQGRRMEIKPAVPKGRATPGTGQMGQMGMAQMGQMDPAQYSAAMAEYYKAYGMQPPQQQQPQQIPPQQQQQQMQQNPLAAMAAAGYTDPKAYLDAMVQAYTTAYGPEMAAQVAAYYAPYLGISPDGKSPGANSDTASNSTPIATTTSYTATTTSPSVQQNQQQLQHQNTRTDHNVDRRRTRSRSPDNSRSKRSRSPRPHSRSPSPRGGRSPSYTRSPSPSPRDRQRSYDRGRDREKYSARYRSRSRSASSDRSRSPPPPPPPPPRRDRSPRRHH